MIKKVFLTGILGQDSSIMAEKILRETNYEIYGLCRRSSNPNLNNIAEIRDNPRFNLIYGDISDEISVQSVIQEIRPDYLFNFAGYTFVEPSWETPIIAHKTNFLGVLHCLEAIRKNVPECRFFNCGSSEQLAGGHDYPQTINTHQMARNHYGCSKIAAHNLIKIYRQKYNLFAVQGILYNHESNRRGCDFVFPKICKTTVMIKNCFDSLRRFKLLEVGSLNTMRDWSAAEDIVDGVWLMANAATPKDYVLSSDILHTVKDVIDCAFESAGLPLTWLIEDGKSIAVDKNSNLLVTQKQEFMRDEGNVVLCGDSSEIRTELGWCPKYNFKSLVAKIVNEEFDKLK